MAKPQNEDRLVGLPATKSGREDRARGKFSRMTPSLALFLAFGVIAVLVVYHFFAQRSLDADKTALLAKQRAAVATVGANWFPLRDKLEGIILDSAKTFPEEDVIVPNPIDFRAMPGIYVRMRVADAKDATSVRAAALESVKDQFCGCLLREPNAPAIRGDLDAGGAPDQPWNLRQAYTSTRILTDDWANEVKASDDDLRLRVFQQQYDKATTEEIPQSIDIMKRARFFLLVLDEDTPEAKAKSDGGVITEDVLQTVTHDARIRIVDMTTWQDIAKMKRTGRGELIPVGENRAPEDSETHDAMTRQVQNCSLGMQVSQGLGFDKDRAPPR